MRNYAHIQFHNAQIVSEFLRLGQIDRAQDFFEKDIVEASIRGSINLSMRYIAAASIQYQADDLKAAKAYLELARPYIERSAGTEMRIKALVCAALLSFNENRADTALRILSDARTIADASGLAILQLHVANTMSIVHAAFHGMLPSSLVESVNNVRIFANDLEEVRLKSLVIARWHLMRYENVDATASLSSSLRKERALGHAGNLAPLLVLQALGFLRQGKLRNARQLLIELLSLANDGIGIRFLLDERDHARELLQSALPLLDARSKSESILLKCGSELLSKLGGDYSGSLSEQAFSRDQLSKRELDVANLIAQGLTNAEISEHLFVSINTVKTHRKHIYAKMKVANTAEFCRVWN